MKPKGTAPCAEIDRILLAHGAGGRMAHQLIMDQFLPRFSNPALGRMDDSAVLDMKGCRLAFTTDSYVVDPPFFPGGDIGRLAVCGTVNDLSMSGARPLYLSLSVIIEEGFPLRELRTIIGSIQRAAEEAEVLIVTGDTKVVEKGGADKIFLNTAGIGILQDEHIFISGNNAQVGDQLILSGSIGDHGIAVISEREGFSLGGNIESDVAPLNRLVQDMLQASLNLHALRDPTRGGLATTLNEIAAQSQVGFMIEESKIPIREPVQGACELLGLDPLYLANEGKLVAVVERQAASLVLQAMKRNPLGKDAEIIGEVVKDPKGMVLLKTKIGGTRVVDMLIGEALPRIC